MYEVVNNAGDVVKRGSKVNCLKWLAAQGYHRTMPNVVTVADKFWHNSTGERAALIRG